MKDSRSGSDADVRRADLKIRYKRSLVERSEELREAITGTDDAETRAIVHQMAHRLSGLAAQIGFDDVGKASAKLEKVSAAPTNDDWSQVVLATRSVMGTIATAQ